jgi:hypothetical protein
MRFELDVNRRNVASADYLSDLKSVAARLASETVTTSQYDRNGIYSASALIRRFGSWAEALSQAGLTVEHHNSGVTAEDAIVDLKKVAQHLKAQTLTQAEYARHGRFSPKPLIRHFGTWIRALEAAGLSRSRNYDISDEELFRNLESMWRTLGRQPKYGEVVKPFSAFSSGTYEQRFGSWRKALEAFVSFIAESLDSDLSPPEPVRAREPSKVPLRRKTVRSINWRLRFLVLRRDSFRCRMCGCSPATKPGTILVVDHVVPWAKGGETVMDNLQALCEPCNGGKSDLPQANG